MKQKKHPEINIGRDSFPKPFFFFDNRSIFVQNNHAFTIIELIIVITIIAIVGITSISGFSRIASIQDSNTTTKVILQTIDSLDMSISNFETTSYETVFSSGSIGFMTQVNWYGKSNLLDYSFDFSTGTGLVMSKANGTGSLELHFASYDTKGKNTNLVFSGGNQIFLFPQNLEKRWYSISAVMNEIIFNGSMMQYYNLNNIKNIQENEIHLVQIRGMTEGLEKTYDSLIIRNILGKKILLGSGSSLDSLTKAVLLFDKNGKEITMNLVQ